MVSRLHSHTTVVAVVYKPVASLGVQLVQHGHCGELSPAKRGELPVSLPGHGEEGITPVHQVTRDQVIWVVSAREGGGDGGGRVQQDGEEHVPVLLHGLVDLGGKVVSAYYCVALLVVCLAASAGLLAALVSLVSFLWSSTLEREERGGEGEKGEGREGRGGRKGRGKRGEGRQKREREERGGEGEKGEGREGRGGRKGRGKRGEGKEKREREERGGEGEKGEGREGRGRRKGAFILHSS